MPQLLSSVELDVGLDHHLVQVTDHEAEEALPTPSQVGHRWVSAGTSAVLLQSVEDIWRARFYFESWDGQPAPLDEAEWPVIEVIGLFLPSGNLAVDQFARGAVWDVFDVGGPGHYRVRLAWCPLDWQPDGDPLEPQAFASLQFWPDTVD